MELFCSLLALRLRVWPDPFTREPVPSSSPALQCLGDTGVCRHI